jgi:hypothetical protein
LQNQTGGIDFYGLILQTVRAASRQDCLLLPVAEKNKVHSAYQIFFQIILNYQENLTFRLLCVILRYDKLHNGEAHE